MVQVGDRDSAELSYLWPSQALRLICGRRWGQRHDTRRPMPRLGVVRSLSLPASLSMTSSPAGVPDS